MFTSRCEIIPINEDIHILIASGRFVFVEEVVNPGEKRTNDSVSIVEGIRGLAARASDTLLVLSGMTLARFANVHTPSSPSGRTSKNEKYHLNHTMK